MSRCFPFPPPGYEKARNDNIDLLKKEKHKEKKQKKDKKEREKRDGKEKHDKDRSKDKKDRKEKRKDKDRDRDKDKTKTPDGKKLEVKPRNGEKLSSNSLQKSDNKDKSSLHLQELAKRLRNEDRASGSQMVPKVGVVVPMVVGRIVPNQLEEKDKVQNKIEGHRRVNGKNNTQGMEKAFGHQNLSSFDKRVDRVEAIIKLEDKKNFKKQMEAKEKNKYQESDGKSEKLGYEEREKSKKSKDKDRGKEEEKKAKEIIEPSKDHFKMNEKVSRAHGGNEEPLNFRNISSPPQSLTTSFASPSEGNLGKRKEIQRNGYSLDNGSRANKLPKNLSFKESAVENGEKSELCHATIDRTPEPLLATNHIVHNNEQKLNGSIASHSKAAIPAKEKGENFSKPPHPDTKYLSQILSVPKMEEWCDLDDQDWLFSSTNSQSKKSNTTSSIQQVWAEAFRIESADISALPYVIPY